MGKIKSIKQSNTVVPCCGSQSYAVRTFLLDPSDPIPPSNNFLLLEDGTDLLLEDGTNILLE